MQKLLISRQLPERVLAAARARFDVTLRDTAEPMTHEECVAALRDFDMVLPTLGDAFRAKAFAEAPDPRCRLLANFGVGYNHIDAEAATRAGVMVSNTPGAVTDATADIALTLILMTARRAGEGERAVRADRWTGWTPTQMLGMHVTGKTLGIIGMGRIGKAIAARCHHGFGMQVTFLNRSKVADPGVPARQVDTMAELMGGADIVVVAVPGGAGTHHLVGAEALAAMQPHAILVNIARGDVVDEAALIAALQAGQLAGAGLDVYEFEPKVPNELKAMEKVTLLPHLGTAALEVREAMGMMALDNVIAVAEGREPPNRV